MLNQISFKFKISFWSLQALMVFCTAGFEAKASDFTIADRELEFLYSGPYLPTSLWLVFDPFFYFNFSGDTESEFIEEYVVKRNTLTFKLKRDKLFHNGDRVTSHDIICSLNAISSLMQNVTPNFHAQGDNQFSIKGLSEAEFLSYFTNTPIVHYSVCETNFDEVRVNLTHNGLTTGPYSIESYEPMVKMELEKINDRESRSHGLPSRITISYISQQQIPYAMKTGDLDLVISNGWDISSDKLLQNSKNIEVDIGKIVNVEQKKEFTPEGILSSFQPASPDAIEDNFFAQQTTFFLVPTQFSSRVEEARLLNEYLAKKDDDKCPKCSKSGACPESFILAAKKKQCPCPKSGACPE